MTNTERPELTSEAAEKITSAKKIVDKPGAYNLKVTSVTPYDGKYIVNLQAMTPYHEEQAQGFAEQGLLQDACNQNLTASQRQQDYIPSKGEWVKVNVDLIENSQGIMCLFVTSLTEIPITTTTRKASLFVKTKVEVADFAPSTTQPTGI
jgi:hypothetical protein